MVVKSQINIQQAFLLAWGVTQASSVKLDDKAYSIKIRSLLLPSGYNLKHPNNSEAVMALNDQCERVINNSPQGAYALWHEYNSDGEIDWDQIGIELEIIDQPSKLMRVETIKSSLQQLWLKQQASRGYQSS